MEKPPISEDKQELSELIKERAKEPGTKEFSWYNQKDKKTIDQAMEIINKYKDDGKKCDPYKDCNGIPNGVKIRPEKSTLERKLEEKKYSK